MEFLDLTLTSPAANVALDEALLLENEAGHSTEILRAWEWSRPAVMLGSGRRLSEDVHDDCRTDHIPILRRSSGGGTVLLGQGCLCFTLVLSYARAPELVEIRSSYAYILGRIRDALAALAPNVRCAGISDLAADGRKFSGNAQQRKRNHLLHHGTILYAFDLALVDRYLRLPTRQPEYRCGRDHRDFLMNLPADADELKRRLRACWGADTESVVWPQDVVRRLVEEKYSKEEWTRRR